ncbi:MAG: hypothetical protein WCF26_07300, partial [Candidatus Sulfotelmatobacter sp.]
AFLVTQLGQQNGNLNLGATTEKQKMPQFPYSCSSIPANLDSSGCMYNITDRCLHRFTQVEA